MEKQIITRIQKKNVVSKMGEEAYGIELNYLSMMLTHFFETDQLFCYF